MSEPKFDFSDPESRVGPLGPVFIEEYDTSARGENDTEFTHGDNTVEEEKNQSARQKLLSNLNENSDEDGVLNATISEENKEFRQSNQENLKSLAELKADKKLQKLKLLIEKSKVYSDILSKCLVVSDDEAEPSEHPEPEDGSDEDGTIIRRSRRTRRPRNKSTGKETRKPRVEQPKMMKNCTMRDYQLQGLSWLITLYENGLNGILADEMGLGKTIQSIAFLCFLIENGNEGPFFVSCPLSTVQNWSNEFKKFAPDVQQIVYYGTPKQRETIRQTEMLRFRSKRHLSSREKSIVKQYSKYRGAVVICSYEMLMQDRIALQKFPFKYLIVDEGHRLKNTNSKLLTVLKRNFGFIPNRLLLTGTPLQNNLNELWSLLNFILPDVFGDLEMFLQWFDFDVEEMGSAGEVLSRESKQNLILSLHQILKPFLLRRLKRDVLRHVIPPKKEFIIYGQLTLSQKLLYTKVVEANIVRDRDAYIQLYRAPYDASPEKLAESHFNLLASLNLVDYLVGLAMKEKLLTLGYCGPLPAAGADLSEAQLEELKQKETLLERDCYYYLYQRRRDYWGLNDEESSGSDSEMGGARVRRRRRAKNAAVEYRENVIFSMKSYDKYDQQLHGQLEDSEVEEEPAKAEAEADSDAAYPPEDSSDEEYGPQPKKSRNFRPMGPATNQSLYLAQMLGKTNEYQNAKEAQMPKAPPKPPQKPEFLKWSIKDSTAPPQPYQPHQPHQPHRPTYTQQLQIHSGGSAPVQTVPTPSRQPEQNTLYGQYIKTLPKVKRKRHRRRLLSDIVDLGDEDRDVEFEETVEVPEPANTHMSLLPIADPSMPVVEPYSYGPSSVFPPDRFPVLTHRYALKAGVRLTDDAFQRALQMAKTSVAQETQQMFGMSGFVTPSSSETSRDVSEKADIIEVGDSEDEGEKKGEMEKVSEKSEKTTENEEAKKAEETEETTRRKERETEKESEEETATEQKSELNGTANEPINDKPIATKADTVDKVDGELKEKTEAQSEQESEKKSKLSEEKPENSETGLESREGKPKLTESSPNSSNRKPLPSPKRKPRVRKYKYSYDIELLKSAYTVAEREAREKKLGNLVMQMRLVCNSPYLFFDPWGNFGDLKLCPDILPKSMKKQSLQTSEADDLFNYVRMDSRIVNNCGKMKLVDQFVPMLIKCQHKVLIFSQFSRVLDMLEDWATLYRNYHVCRIDGGTSQTDRQTQIEKFSADNSADGNSESYDIFLISTRAGGLGINLVAADTVIIYDSDWNPQQDLQAMDRAHRLGQSKMVQVYRLCMSNTVEQLMLHKAGNKLKLEQMIIQVGRFGGRKDVGKKNAEEEKQEVIRELDVLLHKEAPLGAGENARLLDEKELEKLLHR